MASSTLRQGIEKHLLVCSICQGPYKQPKVLPCYHVNCQSCLESKVTQGHSLKCPLCGHTADIPKGGVRALPDFVSMDALASMVNKQNLNEEKPKCCNHEIIEEGETEHMPATFRCTTCKENFCDSCKKAHRLFPATKSHTFVKLNEIKEQSPHQVVSDQSITLQPKQIKMIKGLENVIGEITEHNGMIIALSIPAGGNHDVFVHPATLKESQSLKDRILKACPKPFRIVSLYPSSDKVAVTNHSTYCIKLVSVSEDTIESIKVVSKDSANALALTPQGQIVYSDYNNPKSIKVIEDQYTVRTIFQNHPGNELLQEPWRICTNTKGDVIISDGKKHEVIVMDDNGKVIGKYNDFKKGHYDLYPEGVCVIRNADILVCDRQKKCITHLNSSGKFIADILPGMDSVSLDFKDPNLYVGLDYGELRVFQLY